MVSSGNEVAHPAPVALDETALAAYTSSPVVEYGVVTGSKSGYYVTVGGQKVNVYSNFTIPDGNVTVRGRVNVDIQDHGPSAQEGRFFALF